MVHSFIQASNGFIDYKLRFLALLKLCFFSFNGHGQADRIADLVQILREPDTSYVMVVAHRGDWRNAPENSLQAIENSIKMGVDIVEVDVRMTKDSVFVLMHDDLIDRTTNGTGRVDQLTWNELSTLRLKDGIGVLTTHTIPTLDDAIALSRGKVLLNLDKAYEHPELISQFLEERDFWGHVVLKGWMTDYSMLVENEYLPIKKAFFMPIVSASELEWESVILSYQGSYTPVAFEILFDEEGEEKAVIQMINEMKSKVWINSLWPEFNAGHHDERAVSDLEGSYGWLVKNGAQIIQTDRPKLLIDYLESAGFR